MLTQKSTYDISTNDDIEIETKKNTVTDENVIILHNVTVIGTQNFVVHYSCAKCNSKLTDLGDSLSKCPNCRLLQVLKSCPSKVAVDLYIQHDDHKIMLKAYTSTIKKILDMLKMSI